MSKRLRDFVALLREDRDSRNDAEIGTFVSWLRRKVAILKHVDTPTVIDVVRSATHINLERDELLCRQNKPKPTADNLRFFIILRGSVSVHFNPFISQGNIRRGSSSSFTKVLLAASLSEKILSKPKSAASGTSKRTSLSRVTQLNDPLPEQPESDVSDAESDVTLKVKISTEEVVAPGEKTDDTIKLQRQNTELSPAPQSRSSKSSRKENARSKLGRFLIKYEKGKYFEEDALLDDEGCYNTSVIADVITDVMVLDGEVFNKCVKDVHEKEVMDITNFVDIHPFFSSLPDHSRGVLQLSLKSELLPSGHHIVKQGDPVNKLIFLVSGSAEVIIEPSKHRYQYPDMWPFETSADVYYNECDWLRESRKRVYRRKYEHQGEVSRRNARDAGGLKRQEISVCAVQSREVVGITEVALDLTSHVTSVRCLHDCEVYTLSLKPFRRIARRFPSTMDLIRAYVHMKLQFRIDNGVSDQVPLLRTLLVKIERGIKEKSYKLPTSKNVERQKAQELDMLKLLEWFKVDKAPLARCIDPGAIEMKEAMKKRAHMREMARQRTEEFGIKPKPYTRIGCLAAVKSRREPLSLHQLRDPMNEIMLKLRMEGTIISSEDELEELLMRYSKTPVDMSDDVSRSADRVIDEEYNLLRYRRHGNRLVRNFVKMLDRKDPRFLVPPKSRQMTASVMSGFSEADLPDFHAVDVEADDHDDFEDWTTQRTRSWYRQTTATTKTRPTTFRSLATTDTYKTLQFERRSVTPRTLDMRIRDFHTKCGGKDSEIENLPTMRNYKDLEFDQEESPIRGGRVFVATNPCISCRKHVQLKNHSHVRCQMLHDLPMHKVKGYRH